MELSTMIKNGSSFICPNCGKQTTILRIEFMNERDCNVEGLTDSTIDQIIGMNVGDTFTRYFCSIKCLDLFLEDLKERKTDLEGNSNKLRFRLTREKILKELSYRQIAEKVGYSHMVVHDLCEGLKDFPATGRAVKTWSNFFGISENEYLLLALKHKRDVIDSRIKKLEGENKE